MFGIGGGELVLILFIMLMLFGSEKIPEVARTMGKIMAQLKNATNDIKSEIQKSAETNGLDKTFQEMHGNFTSITQNIDAEISKAKTQLLTDVTPKTESIEEIEDSIGPIKRQK
jgi:sec-independent protein translocase protein TatA